MNEFIELSYDEDSKAHRSMDEEYLYLSGQITATQHLLSVAQDILSGKPVGRE